MTTLITSREIQAPVKDVFNAFSEPERLARWWGPAGFTNTFHTCEFETGGRWVYTMHGPDGRDYPNESIFQEVDPNARIVIKHVIKPMYTLTITFSERATAGTVVSWEQDFENEVFATKMRDFLITANEQNLDRLTAEIFQM
jgi:uncharacterized protein YndB with AHSA1/START domain